MKIAALITVAALTCGTALAQSSGSATERNSSATGNRSAATANDSQSKGGGIVEKTKQAFHRLGEKLHVSGNKSRDNSDPTAQQDPENRNTRAMGASGSDSGRHTRMDQAYSNSRKSNSTSSSSTSR
jgi:hypothetical protein